MSDSPAEKLRQALAGIDEFGVIEYGDAALDAARAALEWMDGESERVRHAQFTAWENGWGSPNLASNPYRRKDTE